jgi:hypothetical protein
VTNETGSGDETLTRYGAHWCPSMTGRNGDLSQTELPNFFGVRRGLTALQVDPFLRIYQAHSRAMNALSSVREGGRALTLATSGAKTDLRQFCAAIRENLYLAGSAARYWTLIYDGGSYFWLGGKPTLPITFDGEGDSFAGTALSGAYVDNAGEIVYRIVKEHPPDGVLSFDTVSMAIPTDFIADTPQPVGIVVGQGETRRTLANKLLATVGGVGFFDRNNSFQLRRFNGVADLTPTITFTERDIVDMRPISTLGPIWRMKMNFAENSTVLGTGQISDDVVGTDYWKFLLDRWRIAKKSHRGTLTLYPRAKSVEIAESCFDQRADVETEILRRLAIYAGEPRAYEVKVRTDGVVLDRFDSFYLNHHDLDAFNALQERLGFDAASAFVIFGVADFMATADSTVTFTAFQDNSV